MKTTTKRNLLVSCLSLFSLTLFLAGCATTSNEATINNTITSSIYGYIGDIQVNGEDYDSSTTYLAGDIVTFVVYPAEDFNVGGATVNGNTASQVLGATNTYQYTLTAGTNRLSATFEIDKTVDLVEKFKLNIDQETFEAVMSDDSTYDFREDGIEEMNLSEYRYCVDGDTTHFTTKLESYTVKVRYLGIDTPESSSVIERWGKAASDWNKSILDTGGTATHVILQSQGRAMYPTLSDGQDESVWESSTDNYNRNLAYVWYTTVDNPTLDDFRCLNLETMYMGFSQGLGSSIEEMGEEYYIAFNKANLSAQANSRNYYSSALDPNYYWDNNDEPVDLELSQLYATTTGGTTSFNTDSPLADNYTFYRVRGYVSRKTETSYFIQDKNDYEQTGDELPEAYGIYVFTYTANIIEVGDLVDVIGVISSYGGNYQMSGTSYNILRPDANKNTTVVSSGHEIVPIRLTAAQFEEQKYRNVLVTITDQLDCKEYTAGYLLNRGGVYEIDTSGESDAKDGVLKYPFYFDDHAITTFGTVGSDTSTYYRIKTADEIYLTHGGQNSYSYKFFSGGTTEYSPNGAKYVYQYSDYYTATTDDTGNEVVRYTINYEERSFTSLTAISQAYVSTSGQTMSMLALIVARGDVTLEYTADLQ